MKHQVIALKLHSGAVAVDGDACKIKLPKRCTGILFCFESKKAAREYWGKDIDVQRVELGGGAT